MKHQKQQQISPETYLRTKVRNLPIEACYINKNWQETGLASIIVARKHKTGNYTLGLFLVDTYALGVKDSVYKFSIPDEEFHEIIEHIYQDETMGSTIMMEEYTMVHNIIYGAIAFAEDNGFKPCREFSITRYILEEDTEDIELIEIEFGKNGKPFLIL